MYTRRSPESAGWPPRLHTANGKINVTQRCDLSGLLESGKLGGHPALSGDPPCKCRAGYGTVQDQSYETLRGAMLNRWNPPNQAQALVQAPSRVLALSESTPWCAGWCRRRLEERGRSARFGCGACRENDLRLVPQLSRNARGDAFELGRDCNEICNTKYGSRDLRVTLVAMCVRGAARLSKHTHSIK